MKATDNCCGPCGNCREFELDSISYLLRAQKAQIPFSHFQKVSHASIDSPSIDSPMSVHTGIGARFSIPRPMKAMPRKLKAPIENFIGLRMSFPGRKPSNKTNKKINPWSKSIIPNTN